MRGPIARIALASDAADALAVDKSLAGLKEKGMTFTDITPAELARMRDATKPVIGRSSAEYDPETVKLFMSRSIASRKFQ